MVQANAEKGGTRGQKHVPLLKRADAKLTRSPDWVLPSRTRASLPEQKQKSKYSRKR
jgi:hypothetical protein